MISVIFITKNEEDMIEDALKSVDWADELLLIDTGNTDRTNSIAKKYNAKIIKYNGSTRDYSAWRNQGLKVAKGDWVLYLDADERITPLLKNEIKEVTSRSDSEVSVYAIPRRNFIFNKEFRHGGQYPDYQKRLFFKKNLKEWRGELHEEPIFVGQLAHLKHPMIHLKNITISQMMEKTNWWSNFEAKLMFDAHHPPMTVGRFISAMVREFWLRMVKQLAFLDGPRGIIYALYQVYSRFVSYAKLWEMQQK